VKPGTVVLAVSSVLMAVALGVLALTWGGGPPSPDAPDEAPGRGSVEPPPLDDRPAESPDPVLPESGALVIRVRREGGAPERGAGVVLERDGVGLARGVTDADGRVRFPADEGPGGVVVLVRGAPVRRFETDLSPGLREVVLRSGEVIEGRVLVDEKPPAEPVLLRLYGGPVSQIGLRTDADGRFLFHGIPDGWRGKLAIPGAFYELVDPPGNGQMFEVRAPTRGLEIRIRAFPVFRGRVLTADGGPANGTKVRMTYETENGGGGSTIATTDAEGRFRIPFAGELTRVKLSIDGPVGFGGKEVEVDPARGLDVGDVVLPSTRVLVLLAVDEAGRPIPGAVARILEGGPTASPHPEGRVTMTITSDVRTVRVGAIGYRVVDVPVPQEPSGPIAVTLPRGNRLDVRVTPHTRLALKISADAAIFAGPEGGPDPVHTGAGAAMVGSASWGNDEPWFFFRIDAVGRATLTGFRPDVPFLLQVVDRGLGGVLHEQRLSLAGDDWRKLEIDVPRGKTLSGKVVDEEGNALSSVRVTVSGDGRLREHTWSEDGAFEIGNLRAAAVMVRAEKKGWVPFQSAAFPVEEGATIVMSRGHSVHVRVRDESGGLLSGVLVRVTAEGFPPWGRGGGVWEPVSTDADAALFEDLPAGEVTFTAEVGGHAYPLTHDARFPVARIDVPALGSVAVKWGFRLVNEVSHRVRLTRADGLDVTAEVDYLPARSEWEIVVPHALPGEYAVSLEYWEDTTDDGVDVYRTLIAGPRVEVKAGERASVEIGE